VAEAGLSLRGALLFFFLLLPLLLSFFLLKFVGGLKDSLKFSAVGGANLGFTPADGCSK